MQEKQLNIRAWDVKSLIGTKWLQSLSAEQMFN